MRRHSACRAAWSAPDRDPRSGAGHAPLSFEADDPRADGGRRRVHILDEAVLLERRLEGLAMRVALPFGAYRGVALSVERRSAFSATVRVTLVHGDPDLAVVLFEASDDSEVTAEWQYWAGRFGLPMLVAEHDGTYSSPFRRLGGLAVEDPRPRRMPAHLARRRPRFLTRRKVAALPAAPVIHREREIIARD